MSKNLALTGLIRTLTRNSSLTGFAFCRIFDDQTAFAMCSSPGLLKYIFEAKMHIVAHLPTNQIKNRYWHKLPIEGAYQEPLRELKKLFGVQGILDYVERHKGYIDQFSFSVRSEQDLSNNELINNVQTGESFVLDFRTLQEPIMGNKKDLPIKELPPEMAPNFKGIAEAESSSLSIARHATLKFRQDLNYILQNGKEPLTAREKDCLLLSLQGYSSPEIALQLNLTLRTVNFYFENIKSKLNVSTKAQLRDRFLA